MQTAQNSALRAVRKCQPDYSVKHLHDELGVEMLSIDRQKSTLKMVFRGVHNEGPPELNEMFNFYIPGRSLRSEASYLILPPKCKTSVGDNDIAARGCYYWDSVDIELRQIETLEAFKSLIKVYEPP